MVFHPSLFQIRENLGKKKNEIRFDLKSNDIRSFRSISSHRRTSLTNFR
jgi:hypothetical protein